MQCSVTLAREHDYGHVKMKNYNNYKNSYKKDSNVDIKQLCQRLNELREGMPTCSIEQAEAIRRYYEAFPALDKCRAEPAPPAPAPAWRRNMPPAPPPRRPHHTRSQHPRRNSYHGPKKQKKPRTDYTKSLEGNLPEWMHHEGVWDMEDHDPVKEFIRAIALDEGYGTGDRAPPAPRLGDKIADWEPPLDIHADWALDDQLEPAPLTPIDASLYEQFAAKFDRSLAALWDAPDDLSDLPVDLNLLLASPSDEISSDFNELSLPDRLQPLRLDTELPRLEPIELLPDEAAEALPAVAGTLRSLTAINHSRDASGFAEVPPRRPRAPAAPAPAAPAPAAPAPAAPAPPPPPPPRPPTSREDLLTSSRTHFRPIRREPDADAAPRYADGDTFDIRGELEAVDFSTSPAGHSYLHGDLYLEYRTRSIHYDRLQLTAEQRCPDLEDDRFRLRFPLRQTDAAVQTEPPACECPRAKKMRAGEEAWRRTGPALPPRAAPQLLGAELAHEWDQLVSDISVAVRLQAPDRKRRHSGARPASPRCPRPPHCAHPHARFLHCCLADRPLTR